MSDTIYDWARRELHAIQLNGKELDLKHLSALAYVTAELTADAIQETRRTCCGATS